MLRRKSRQFGQVLMPLSLATSGKAIAENGIKKAEGLNKNGSLPEDKLPLRLCWGNLPLAIPVAACSASGFRASALMVGGFPRVRLRFFASVPDPQLVQLPDDLSPSDPFRLAPSLFGLSPIIDRESIFLFLRKTNYSSRPSSGSRAVLRVIADWSLVRPFAFR